jgi:hypothetical protein
MRMSLGGHRLRLKLEGRETSDKIIDNSQGNTRSGETSQTPHPAWKRNQILRDAVRRNHPAWHAEGSPRTLRLGAVLFLYTSRRR